MEGVTDAGRRLARALPRAPDPRARIRAGGRAVSLYETVKRANQPGPPEHSVLFRAASAGSVVVAIAACWAQGELPGRLAAGSIVLIVVGNVFSYRRRSRPAAVLEGGPGRRRGGLVRLVLRHHLEHGHRRGPLVGRGAPGHLVHPDPGGPRLRRAVAARPRVLPRRVGHLDGRGRRPGDRHHLRALRRRLGRLRAAGAAGHVGLDGRGGPGADPDRWRSARLAVVVVGTAIVAVVPAPHAASNLVFPSALAGDVPVSQPAGLVGGGSKGNEPLHAASATGADPGRAGSSASPAPSTRPSGARSATRSSSGSGPTGRPSGWPRRSTDWDGQSWAASPAPPGTPTWRLLVSGPPFDIPPSTGEELAGSRGLPDLLPGPGGAEPRLPRRQRRRGLVPLPATVRGDRRDHPGRDLDGARLDLHRRCPASTRRPRPSCRAASSRGPSPARSSRRPSWPATSSSPTPIPAVGALARRITADRPHHLRQGHGPRGLDRRPYPLHHRHPSRWRRARTPSTSSSSATARATASRSPRRWP